MRPPGRGARAAGGASPMSGTTGGGSPDPIPNSAVKPRIAESTATPGRGRTGRSAHGRWLPARRRPGRAPDPEGPGPPARGAFPRSRQPASPSTPLRGRCRRGPRGPCALDLQGEKACRIRASTQVDALLYGESQTNRLLRSDGTRAGIRGLPGSSPLNQREASSETRVGRE